MSLVPMPTGAFILRLDGVGPGDAFDHPHGMATDSEGNLYIAVSSNQRIVKFALPPR